MSRVVKTPFTDLDASRLYARLVNDLDPEPFIARLAPDVHYCSHWVIEDIDEGAQPVANAWICRETTGRRKVLEVKGPGNFRDQQKAVPTAKRVASDTGSI